MNNSGFDMRLGIESALRRALPYGGLPGKDSPQTAFFDAATEGDLRRLRGEKSPRRAPSIKGFAVHSRAAPAPFDAASHLLGFWWEWGACACFGL
jgi:hypothetical protein